MPPGRGSGPVRRISCPFSDPLPSKDSPWPPAIVGTAFFWLRSPASSPPTSSSTERRGAICLPSPSLDFETFELLLFRSRADGDHQGDPPLAEAGVRQRLDCSRQRLGLVPGLWNLLDGRPRSGLATGRHAGNRVRWEAILAAPHRHGDARQLPALAW